MVFARRTLEETDLGRYERLWVEVLDNADPSALAGELDNQPTFIRGLPHGSPIAFTKDHIFAILRARRARR